MGYAVRSKVWVEGDDGKVAFGLGRYRILMAIKRLGSIQAAAKELKMSYRAVWCRIRVSETLLGRALVERRGKGSCLTSFAEELMKRFKRLQTLVEQETNDIFDDLLRDQLHR